MSRIGDALKRAGSDEADGFATLGDDGADLFAETKESTPRPSRAQPPAAGPQEIAEVPAGLFEPFSEDVDEKTVVHASVNPVAREQDPSARGDAASRAGRAGTQGHSRR